MMRGLWDAPVVEEARAPGIEAERARCAEPHAFERVAVVPTRCGRCGYREEEERHHA